MKAQIYSKFISSNHLETEYFAIPVFRDSSTAQSPPPRNTILFRIIRIRHGIFFKAHLSPWMVLSPCIPLGTRFLLNSLLKRNTAMRNGIFSLQCFLILFRSGESYSLQRVTTSSIERSCCSPFSISFSIIFPSAISVSPTIATKGIRLALA